MLPTHRRGLAAACCTYQAVKDASVDLPRVSTAEADVLDGDDVTTS